MWAKHRWRSAVKVGGLGCSCRGEPHTTTTDNNGTARKRFPGVDDTSKVRRIDRVDSKTTRPMSLIGRPFSHTRHEERNTSSGTTLHDLRAQHCQRRRRAQIATTRRPGVSCAEHNYCGSAAQRRLVCPSRRSGAYLAWRRERSYRVAAAGESHIFHRRDSESDKPLETTARGSKFPAGATHRPQRHITRRGARS